MTFSQFTPLYVPKNLSNAAAQVFSQFRHCKLPEEATTRGVDLQLYYKDTPTQVFSCEIFEIFRNTYFEEQKPTITLQ